MADISSLIEQIRAGLDAATAGQWTWGQKYVCHKDGWDYTRLFNTPDDKQAPEGSQWERDATHVANCCPDNIRRLLEHIVELEARTEWRPILDAPHACHVLAAWFDHDFGEWVMEVVPSPPCTPFTHWKMLGRPSAPGGRDNA